MKISVITPTFNSEKTISENVNSVLFQTYNEFEHIIVDNCSKDSTIDIITKIYNKNNSNDKLIIISEKDEGISDAFNKGIAESSGEIITILNSDDKYFSNKVFNDIIKYFENQNILFVHGDILFNDEKFGSNLRKPLMCDIKIAMPFNHPTMFFRKEIFEKFGYFDKSFKYSMDYEFICRISKKLELSKVSYYYNNYPLVIMNAGGASWNNEINSINETKRALKIHNLWGVKSYFYYSLRIIRTITKKFLNQLGLSSIVKIWRDMKWS